MSCLALDVIDDAHALAQLQIVERLPSTFAVEVIEPDVAAVLQQSEGVPHVARCNALGVTAVDDDEIVPDVCLFAPARQRLG